MGEALSFHNILTGGFKTEKISIDICSCAMITRVIVDTTIASNKQIDKGAPCTRIANYTIPSFISWYSSL